MLMKSSLMNSALGTDMDAVGEVVPGEHNGRTVLKTNGQTRIALPMAYVENCASKVESDFLWRFFEAADFSSGETMVVNGQGAPMGRYADYMTQVGPEAYVRLEIQAFRWVRKYGLGREWAAIAEIFLRMMAERVKIGVVEWGGLIVNSDDERIGLGSGQATLCMLGIRLKDAYRDFFRWYRYVSECEARGDEPTATGAYASMERDKRVAMDIQRFKQDNGLMPPAPAEVTDAGANSV